MQFHPLEAAKLKDQNMSRRDTYILLSKLYNRKERNVQEKLNIFGGI